MMINIDQIKQFKASQPLTFSDALVILKSDMKVKRIEWKDVEFIKIKKPNLANDGSSREAVIVNNSGVKYSFTDNDILYNDWVIVE